MYSSKAELLPQLFSQRTFGLESVIKGVYNKKKKKKTSKQTVH